MYILKLLKPYTNPRAELTTALILHYISTFLTLFISMTGFITWHLPNAYGIRVLLLLIVVYVWTAILLNLKDEDES